MSSWDRSWLRKAIAVAVVLKVMGLILVVDWTARATNPFDLPKSLYSRALEWVLLALLLAAFVSWGTSVLPQTRLHLLVVGILAAAVLSTLTAAEPYLATFGTQGRYLGLTFVADMAVLYLAVAVAFRTRRDCGILFAGLAAALV